MLEETDYVSLYAVVDGSETLFGQVTDDIDGTISLKSTPISGEKMKLKVVVKVSTSILLLNH